MPTTKKVVRKTKVKEVPASEEVVLAAVPEPASAPTEPVMQDTQPSRDDIRESAASEPQIEDRPSYGRPQSRYSRDNYGSDMREDRYEENTVPVSGILDIQHEGHGFLRPKFRASDRDIYISASQIRRFWLRSGDLVEGSGRPPKDNERYFGLLKIEKVNGDDPETSMRRPHFDDLTPIYPKEQVMLATGKTPLSTRMIDLVSPIGFGQRGMIVSPPKAGKTTIIKDIAAGISANYADVHLMAVLIGERPEEVTDISRSVRGEVVASNFDESPETQTRIAEIAMERAKRLVERGVRVVVLLDSITRLARAYNLSIDPSGRTLTGGFDPAALYPAKKFFGAARNCEEGGSLTIIGTALVDTGSRMDDLIFEEFKGTGNMEVHLDRRLAERRIYPAINIERSGTRAEELILSEDTLKKVVLLRRMIDVLNPDERTEVMIERLQKTDDNKEFLASLAVPKD
ncbi:MAG TPA: transcription termination factor Rho [Patescibacteria group bacterium]|nr:transcription termination factor Rho [Patescibacteria group bacterium]